VQQLRDLVKANAKLYRDALSFPYMNHKEQKYKERSHYKDTQSKSLSSDEMIL
jgi:hypothetical protein